jgi:hypothetical protein
MDQQRRRAGGVQVVVEHPVDGGVALGAALVGLGRARRRRRDATIMDERAGGGAR